ncbi:unnamed protein product [Sphagnum troendelagicum]|uniref:Alpha-glucosidase n=1 Tax=Sphagnum troendelagicum TaxID=128251 RepID=A0ABP0UKS5_9BRYO
MDPSPPLRRSPQMEENQRRKRGGGTLDGIQINNPFPGEPRGLKLVRGQVLFDAETVGSSESFAAGSGFRVEWKKTQERGRGGGGGSCLLSVFHHSQPHTAAWSTAQGTGSFISAALGDGEIVESRGSFALHDHIELLCRHQTIEQISSWNPPPHPTSIAIGTDASSSASSCGIQNNSMSSSMFSAQEELLRSRIDADGTLLSNEGPCVLVTGCFSSNDGETEERRIRRRRRRNWMGFFLHDGLLQPIVGVRYYLVFCERRDHHLGFHVWLDRPQALDHHRCRRSSISSSSSSPQFLSYKRPALSNSSSSSTRKTTSSNKSSNILALLREQRDDDDDVQLPQFNRIQITYSSHKGERFYGFGEQFSHFDMKGKRVPILVQEQGLGRGDQPITAAANLVAHRAGGAWHTTYAPSPHYMTSDLHSVFLENFEYSVFDLTENDRVQLQVHADSVQGRILQGHTPAELIKHYTAATGRMRELPSWITKGAIVGMQGGLQAVHQVWEKLQDLDVPLSAFWLQDWVGQRKTNIGWQLWWNWEVDSKAYPDWEKLVQDLRAHGIRTMTYCNPFLASTDEKPNRRQNMFDDAKNEGMVVGDNTGAPYMIPNTSFNAAMLDLTNPAARKWFKSILHDMVKTGVRGWMADFGESLPFDSCLYSGEDPATAHNKYPELWAELNREFLEEWEKEHKVHSIKQSSKMCTESGEDLSTDEENQDDDEEQLVFFMRAGYRGSPQWSTLFWAGDQMVSWQRHDGIKSAVTGLLTSGLSGYAFNHSDIGGYCTVDLPFLRYRRSEELLLRWMELNAFSTIFRTHEGNIPAANSQFYSNERTLAHFARCAKMYKAWEFYRRQLVKEAATTGMPVVRHMFLHYPHDKHVQSIVYQQFLVGSDILVVPVLDKGCTKVHAYFPAGDVWKHVWTGILYSGAARAGQKAWVQAPLGFPAVFVKAGSQVATKFMANLVHQGVVNKKLSSTAPSQQ